MSDYKVHGTVAELEALNIPVDRYPTCSKRVLDGNDVVILGCPAWKACKCPEKKTGAGPVNKGLRLVKKGVDGRTRIIHTTLTCYDIPFWYQQLEPMGGAVEIIANEGEDILLKGTRAKDEVIPGQGQTRTMEPFAEHTKVPKFYRPGTGTNLADEAGTKDILEQMKADRIAERLDKAAGVTPEDKGGRAKSTPRG